MTIVINVVINVIMLSLQAHRIMYISLDVHDRTQWPLLCDLGRVVRAADFQQGLRSRGSYFALFVYHKETLCHESHSHTGCLTFCSVLNF